MPKYLWKVSYSPQAIGGVLREGGTSRRDAIAELAREQGGSIEAFYFAFGETDVYCIATLPDDVTAAAVSMTVAASGIGSIATVRLIDPEDVDEATKKTIAYRGPGA